MCMHWQCCLSNLQIQSELKRYGLLTAPVQAHYVSAFGKLQEMIQHYGPSPHSLILHSWSSSAEMVH